MATRERVLSPAFLRLLRAQERAYLARRGLIRRSGFAGGSRRWRREREPILDAVDSDGAFLDVGCANGYLVECLARWARGRGIRLTPHGVDAGSRLIELARARMPPFAANFHVGNAWDWLPPRRYAYTYTLYDCVPRPFLPEYVRRLLTRTVVPGGRLIVGAYGSRSRQRAPFDVTRFLALAGFRVAGSTVRGRPLIVHFAWIDRTPGR